MWQYGYGMMGWIWIVGAAIALLVVVAVIVFLRLIPGSRSHPEVVSSSAALGGLTPRQILDERYAKGDLDTEEYLERVRHLGSD